MKRADAEADVGLLQGDRPAAASDGLLELIGEELDSAAMPAARALADEILRRHGSACSAILFYGSALRSGETDGVILDLLVVVDSYREAYAKRWQAFVNAVLAPNVFYLEAPSGGAVVRAKYAVVSMALLQRGTAQSTLQVYYWGRFSQPCLLVYARSPEVRAEVRAALAQAVTTFVERAIPLASFEFRAEDLWRAGLAACYGTELRAERPGNLDRLMEIFGERCARVTRAALVARCGPAARSVRGEARPERVLYQSDLSSRARSRSRTVWFVRRVQGKLLHLLRLVKGVFTFEGGADYILWKIERHSGVRVDASPRARRHPLIFGWGTLWKLYRRGAFR